MRLYVSIILAASVLFFSCRPQRAIINYVEDMNDTASARQFFITEPKVQKNDLLSIQVFSTSLDPTLDVLYNLPAGSNQGQSQVQQGYLVDQKGNIEMPRIGTIHAEGLTKAELSEVVKARLRSHLNDPSVIIRFLNFRIIIIGEVGSPGVVTVPVENLTLLEGLAMAGDITEFGNKKQVKILREYNGQRQLGLVDVSSSSMFESPYYQLQQNDVIMVEQTRYKLRQTEQQRITQQLGFALSIITSIALLYNIFQ